MHVKEIAHSGDEELEHEIKRVSWNVELVFAKHSETALCHHLLLVCNCGRWKRKMVPICPAVRVTARDGWYAISARGRKPMCK
jgi:hypothetical protein